MRWQRTLLGFPRKIFFSSPPIGGMPGAPRRLDTRSAAAIDPTGKWAFHVLLQILWLGVSTTLLILLPFERFSSDRAGSLACWAPQNGKRVGRSPSLRDCADRSHGPSPRADKERV